MSDYIDSRSGGDSIEETRRKKMEEFRRTADRSAIRGEYDGRTESSAASRDYDLDTFDAGESYDPGVSRRESSEERRGRRKRNREINSYSDNDTRMRIERDSKKALKQQKKEEKKIEKSKAKRNRRIFKLVWLSMIVIVAVVLSQYILVGVNDLLGVSREENATKVTLKIPANPTIDQIADILYQSRVIKQPGFFKLYAGFTSSEDGFRQGDFEIETDKDYEAIINFLQSNVNRTDIVTVQITEGMNTLEIANTLHEQGVISDMQQFFDLCNSSYFDDDFTFLTEFKNADERYYKLEGYLFPDTYYFYIGEDPKSVITKFLNNYENKVILHKEKYFSHSKKSTLESEAKSTGYTTDEILTIASIIQAEAASREDMYYISSILHNRLKYGVEYGAAQLNCDCTVYYPYRKASDVPESIRATYHSTYNTNDFTGLPPGPICNPGAEAIKAAINPYETDYLYFCHDTVENGSTPYYSTSIDEHNYYLSIIADGGFGDDYYGY